MRSSAVSRDGKKPHRLVLTGATGTLGTALLELLGHDPRYRVLVLLRRPARNLDRFPSVSARVVDFHNTRQLGRRIRSFCPKTVVHAAANGMEFPRPSWIDLADANISLPLRLLEACRQCPRVPHVILISTGLAYRNQGRPLRENDPLGTVHPYGASKAAADLVIQSAAADLRIPLTVLRPFSFTGPGDIGSRLFPSLLRAAQSKTPLQLTSGRQVRDFLSARDVAAGIIAVAQKSSPPVRQAAIYNLGSGTARPVRRIVQEAVRELGLKVMLRFGKKKTAEGEPGFLVADGRKARRELGWAVQENLAHAVWRLARASFPRLDLPEPAEKARIR